MKTHIQNYGIAKTIIQTNNRKSKNAVKWMGDYDGNILNMDLKIDDNGKQKHMKMALDNEDLIHLLNIPSHNKPIDERLMEDLILLNENKAVPSFEILEPEVLDLIVSKKKRKTGRKRRTKKRKTRKFFDNLL